MNRCIIASVVVFGSFAIRATAAPTVDGTVDAAYGAAIAVQGVNTGFGDANFPTAGQLNGSELDAGYATISGGRLYLMLTGNLEPNFNKLEVFFDSKAGGENVMSGTPQYDYFDGSKWISQNMGGMTFDTGFTADYHLYTRWGGGNTPGQFEVDFVNRNGGADAAVPASSGKSVDSPTVNLTAIGSIPAGNIAVYNTASAPSSALTQSLDFAINDNNAGGVVGGAGPYGAADTTAAAAVTTGMEFSIALADLGNPAAGSTIKIAAMINNSNHNYLSNQVLGTLPLTDGTDPPSKGNLAGNGLGGDIGDLSGINFNSDLLTGLQYFTVAVPSAAVAGDYNGNGIVDAADYTIWRDTLGSTTDLRANGDNTGASAGKIDQADFTFWKTHFGGPGSASLGGGAVPEPSSIALAIVGILLGGRMLRRQQ
jgi:hypothetical protein